MNSADSNGVKPPQRTFRALVPWWARIAGKLALSRIPLSYRAWRGLNLFTHGLMDRPAYALEVFRDHFRESGLSPGAPFTCLELGPGDSLFSAVVARAHGADHTYLVDDGKFATLDVGAYRELAAYLKLRGLDPPGLDDAADVAAVLAACKATYHVKGVESLQEISTASVHFIWSHAVLEHVRRAQVPAMAREMRRVLRPDGICSHQVDIRDHLGGALNNLRVPSGLWEKEWMARSGFYTNRLRRSEFVRIFEAAGFRAQITQCAQWERAPISRRSLASEFQALPDEDLRIQDFLVLLRPVS